MRNQSLTIAYLLDGVLVTATRLYDLEMLIEEMTQSMNGSYGIGDWLCCPTIDIPADLTPDTYTITGGKLVPVEKPAAV